MRTGLGGASLPPLWWPCRLDALAWPPHCWVAEGTPVFRGALPVSACRRCHPPPGACSACLACSARCALSQVHAPAGHAVHPRRSGRLPGPAGSSHGGCAGGLHHRRLFCWVQPFWNPPAGSQGGAAARCLTQRAQRGCNAPPRPRAARPNSAAPAQLPPACWPGQPSRVPTCLPHASPRALLADAALRARCGAR